MRRDRFDAEISEAVREMAAMGRVMLRDMIHPPASPTTTEETTVPTTTDLPESNTTGTD